MDVEDYGVTQVPPTKQADGGQLMSLGAVAAVNIAQALGLGPDVAAKIETEIKNEIDAMSSHFQILFADLETQKQLAETKVQEDYAAFIASAKARETIAIKSFRDKIADVKSAFTYVEENRAKVATVLAGVLLLGVLIGVLV